ncbi:hypothetical protein L596_014264 [Steinernema carpocapsae]|uniref:Uncharacterized protein n=1 Tax=Steinernema carpocapsae TaxID=34508 RepID=A0A4U5NBY8_STECR|nr:hypothetical protein L596_014264 [Steinernema carpocapsae]
MTWLMYRNSECYPSEDICKATCNAIAGVCYFEDRCNGLASGYFCSEYNGFTYLLVGFTIIALLFTCCCACFGYQTLKNCGFYNAGQHKEHHRPQSSLSGFQTSV